MAEEPVCIVANQLIVQTSLNNKGNRSVTGMCSLLPEMSVAELEIFCRYIRRFQIPDSKNFTLSQVSDFFFLNENICAYTD